MAAPLVGFPKVCAYVGVWVCEVSPQLTERDKYECYSQQLKKFSS